ncbi:MAG: hypothetical protein JW751_26060 [Polyangiaceae bacterium]|nr:hypothetical protein [Polyangiaceae bacterium]
MTDPNELSRRLRFAIACALGSLLALLYVTLPDGNDSLIDSGPVHIREVDEKLEILEVRPSSPAPGSVIVVEVVGAEDPDRVSIVQGKKPLEVFARRDGSVAVRLPEDLEPGRMKIRAVVGDERSKTYHLRVKALDWRKPFRKLIGGLALLLFGVHLLSSGAREAAGAAIARTFARLARRPPLAAAFGVGLGALTQSTTAVAALLSGLVSSELLAIVPAAVGLAGAALGTALLPLLLGSLFEPREGLVLITLGVAGFLTAIDRRTTALARAVLGAGLIAYGVHVARPGLELLVTNPALLSTLDHLSAQGVASRASCVLLGAGLVALLQGPVPLFALTVAVAGTTGHWDIRAALSLLCGTGLGAAACAVLTTPIGAKGRRLAVLYLALGAASTLLAAATVDLSIYAADAVLATGIGVLFSSDADLPSGESRLVFAFAASQLSVVLLLTPLAAALDRTIARLGLRGGARLSRTEAAILAVLRAELVKVLREEQQALVHITELGRQGVRGSGRAAERHLRVADERLSRLFSGDLALVPTGLEGNRLSRAAYACRQLQRGLEVVLGQAEILTDLRVTSGEVHGLIPLSVDEERWLTDAEALLRASFDAVIMCLEAGVPADLEPARSREIRLNGIEAKARAALLVPDSDPDARRSLAVLPLVDAFETAGNQIYRLSEALAGDPLALPSLRPPHSNPESALPPPSVVPSAARSRET